MTAALASAVLALSGASAVLALVVRHRCGSRGRLAHLTLCAAMAAMAEPAFAMAGPLAWAAALGSMAYWVAGASGPVADRLPVLCDLVCTAVLVVVMPLSMTHGAAPVGGHHHMATGSGSSTSFAPVVLIAGWAGARSALWWRSRRNAPLPRGRLLALAEAPMAAAMILMAW